MTLPELPAATPTTRLGHYELVRRLAQGGMADVYLAQQAGLDRKVALKVLNPQRGMEAEACALFIDEARLVGMLNHQNLASVYDVDSHDGVHYLAMEYVDGADLREILAKAQSRDSEIAYDCAVSIVAAAATGLDYAHRRCDQNGRPLLLVHRDVSLSNIMVARDGRVKVIDFGIATSTASVHVTNPGVVRGKAAYMAPEQCLGDPVDLRTDVFALGIVLYELTTGRRCFVGNSDFERMVAVVRAEFEKPSALIPDFPLTLEQVILTALSPDPAHRYASAAAMIDALEAAAAVEGWQLGTDRTALLMQALFGRGDVEREAQDEPYICPPPPAVEICAAVCHAQPTRVISRRRLARGTDDVTDWQDDAPTRGRRSISHYTWTPRLAA